jgi:hypothetical protein
LFFAILLCLSVVITSHSTTSQQQYITIYHITMSSSTTPKTATTGEVVKEPPTFNEIMNKAAASAVRGGTAGAVAMGANVACLMWMRTTVSFNTRWD